MTRTVELTLCAGPPSSRTPGGMVAADAGADTRTVAAQGSKAAAAAQSAQRRHKQEEAESEAAARVNTRRRGRQRHRRAAGRGWRRKRATRLGASVARANKLSGAKQELPGTASKRRAQGAPRHCIVSSLMVLGRCNDGQLCGLASVVMVSSKLLDGQRGVAGVPRATIDMAEDIKGTRPCGVLQCSRLMYATAPLICFRHTWKWSVDSKVQYQYGVGSH